MNEIRVGNTPIFEQLLREYESRGKVYESLVTGGPTLDLRPAEKHGVRPLHEMLKEGFEGLSKPFATPDAWKAQATPQEPPDKACVSEIVDPLVLHAEGDTVKGYSQKLINRFVDENPDTQFAEVRIDNNLDGTITISVREAVADEPEESSTPVIPRIEENAFAKAAREHFRGSAQKAVRTDSEPPNPSIVTDFIADSYQQFFDAHPNAVITDVSPRKNSDGSVSMVIEAVERPKRNEEELYDQQVTPKQTDKSVNAASALPPSFVRMPNEE